MRCSRCKRDLDAGAFYVDRSRSTGVSSRCRTCDRAWSAERYAANPSPRLEASQRWRDANRENKRAADAAYRKRKRDAK